MTILLGVVLFLTPYPLHAGTGFFRIDSSEVPAKVKEAADGVYHLLTDEVRLEKKKYQALLKAIGRSRIKHPYLSNQINALRKCREFRMEMCTVVSAKSSTAFVDEKTNKIPSTLHSVFEPAAWFYAFNGSSLSVTLTSTSKTSASTRSKEIKNMQILFPMDFSEMVRGDLDVRLLPVQGEFVGLSCEVLNKSVSINRADMDARVGDDVYVLGYPKRIVKDDREITDGVSLYATKGKILGLGEGADEDLIFFDAALEGGMSGGPILNADGKWLGVAVQSEFRMQVDLETEIARVIKTPPVGYSSARFDQTMQEIADKSGVSEKR